MVSARIRGGLGNELFQYSTARSLADHLNVDLGLDTREFDKSSPYKMSLNQFTLRANFNPPNLIKHKRYGMIAYLLDHISGNQRKVYKEPFLMFDKNLLSLADGTYLKGYWQTEKYFIKNKEKIIKDLTLIHEPDGLNVETLKEIQKSKSISLHIRRGDYVSNKTYNQNHGIIDLSYYEKAVNHISKKIGNDIKVFAFSDDPDWVYKNLNLPFQIKFIDNNSSENSYEDLRLMLNCDHNIIANSSFSWWGAWLNLNPNKIIISPQKWYGNKQIQNPDIVPSTWLKY